VANDIEQLRQASEADELRQHNLKLQRQLAKAKAGTEALIEAVYSAARDAAITVGRPKLPKPPVDTRRKLPEVALVHATDWQVGKRSDSYSSDIAAQRISTLAAKVAKLTDIQRADHPVKHCVLMLGGDMVEGITVFAGQAYEVDSTQYEQLFRVVSIIEQLVIDLLVVFETVEVVCEYGNHGRIGRKGENPAGDNWDLIAYRIASERFKGNERVTWQLSGDWHQMVTIGNYRALLFHGDEIKSFGGNTPAFGILRKITSWSSGVIEDFMDAYGGHFHTPMTLTTPNGGQIYMTGSPESDNVYAAEFVAAKGRPSQRLHFVDPEAGRVTASYLVWLD
jgi:hypothetical protein